MFQWGNVLCKVEWTLQHPAGKVRTTFPPPSCLNPNISPPQTLVQLNVLMWCGSEITAASTHRLVGADGVDLGPKHDCSEDQKEETFEAEEDEEDDSRWWREVTALWRGRKSRERKIFRVKKKKFVTCVKHYSYKMEFNTPDTLTIQSALTGDNQINNEGKLVISYMCAAFHSLFLRMSTPTSQHKVGWWQNSTVPGELVYVNVASLHQYITYLSSLLQCRKQNGRPPWLAHGRI